MEQTREGKAMIRYPPGRVSKKDEVFFNPAMRTNRDLSVLAARVFSETNKLPLRIMDAFSASGVRGIRYMLECENAEHVIFNDLNPKAMELIKNNLEMNGIKDNYELSRKDARILFLEKRGWSTLIDIDPFGTPAPYIDAAAGSCAKLCLLGITATDTAPLCGTYPDVALRRYFASTVRFDAMQEQGLRVLISFVVREMAKHDRAFIPLISIAERHYFRIVGAVKRSTKEANNAIEKSRGFLSVCASCGYRKLSMEEITACDHCGNKPVVIHPVWIGTIFNKKFCDRMLEISKQEGEIYSSRSRETLSIITQEAEINNIMYDLHFLAKLHKIRYMASVEDVVETLLEQGFAASRTHIRSTAIRTDAPLESIIHALGKIRK